MTSLNSNPRGAWIMAEPSVVHNTFVLERTFPKSPKTVFSAFADASKKQRWCAEGEGHDLLQYQLDFRVGGTERLQYRLGPGTPVTGMIITNEARYQHIEPEQRIVTATTMDLGEKRILISLVTFEFLPNGSGTDLILTNQGSYLDGVTGLTPKMLEAGWRGLLEQLAAELAK